MNSLILKTFRSMLQKIKNRFNLLENNVDFATRDAANCSRNASFKSRNAGRVNKKIKIKMDFIFWVLII